MTMLQQTIGEEPEVNHGPDSSPMHIHNRLTMTSKGL